MLLYAMSVSVDGYVADRDGGFDWGAPGDELFAFHLDRVRSLGAYLLGRRLYEAMTVWETDPSLRTTAPRRQFAQAWVTLPKIVFSRSLDRVAGTATLATAGVAETVAATLAAVDGDVEIGGPGLAGQAFALGLVDELRITRIPVVVGGGTPYLPAVTRDVRLESVEIRRFDGGVVHERYRVLTRSS